MFFVNIWCALLGCALLDDAAISGCVVMEDSALGVFENPLWEDNGEFMSCMSVNSIAVYDSGLFSSFSLALLFVMGVGMPRLQHLALPQSQNDVFIGEAFKCILEVFRSTLSGKWFDACGRRQHLVVNLLSLSCCSNVTTGRALNFS